MKSVEAEERTRREGGGARARGRASSKMAGNEGRRACVPVLLRIAPASYSRASPGGKGLSWLGPSVAFRVKKWRGRETRETRPRGERRKSARRAATLAIARGASADMAASPNVQRRCERKPRGVAEEAPRNIVRSKKK